MGLTDLNTLTSFTKDELLNLTDEEFHLLKICLKVLDKQEFQFKNPTMYEVWGDNIYDEL